MGRKRAREGDEGDDESVELGRRESVAPRQSLGGEGAFDLGVGEDAFEKGSVRNSDFGGEEIRFDDAFGDIPVGEGGGADREFTPINFDGSVTGGDINLTPNAAAAIAARQAADERPAKKQRKLRHQLVDEVTELDGQAGRTGNGTGVAQYKEPEFLPRSRLLLRIDEIRSSMDYYTPKDLGNGMRSFAPKNMHPRLQAMFSIPTRERRIVDEGRKRAPSALGEDDVELGRRRQSSVFSHRSGFDAAAGGFGEDAFGGFDVHADVGAGFDGDLGGEEIRFDNFGEDEAGRDVALGRVEREDTPRAAVAPTARQDSPDRDADGRKRAPFVTTGPLALFAEADSASQAASSTQGARSLAADEESAPTEAGFSRFSRSTAKAIAVLKAQFAEEDEVEFGRVAEPARVAKKDAAKFFFETLVLSTRGHIRVKQEAAYAPITMRANESLFGLGEEVRA